MTSIIPGTYWRRMPDVNPHLAWIHDVDDKIVWYYEIPGDGQPRSKAVGHFKRTYVPVPLRDPNEITLFGTGHRPDKLGGYGIFNPVQQRLIDWCGLFLYQLQPKEVRCGMALGFDQWMAAGCIKYGVPFTAYVPYENYPDGAGWGGSAVVAYEELLAAAASVVVVSPVYHDGVMQQRNEAMVSGQDTPPSDLGLACWNGTSGGTANCLDYAKMAEVPTLIIGNPKLLELPRQ